MTDGFDRRSPGSALAVLYVAGLLLGISTLAAETIAPAEGAAVGHAPRASGSWATYLESPQRVSAASGQTWLSVADAPKLKMLWNLSTGGPVVTEPAILNGHVYFGSWDGYEYAANDSNGTPLWKSYSGHTQCGAGGFPYGVSSSSTVQGGVDFFGGGGTSWEAVAAPTGKLLWSVYTGNNSNSTGGGHYNWASPLLAGGAAYVGIASACDTPLVVGQLLEVSLKTHRVVAEFNATNASRLGASIWASPSLDRTGRNVFVATGNFNTPVRNLRLYDDSLLELNATTLAVVGHWHVPIALVAHDGDFGATPTVFQDVHGTAMVGAANKDGHFFAFDQSNLSAPVWDLPFSTGTPTASAAFDGANVYLGGPAARITGPSSPNGTMPNGTAVNGTLWSVNATTGKVNWVRAMRNAVFGAPVYDNGVVVAAGGAELDVVNAQTGALLYHYRAPKQFYGGASIGDGRIIIGDNDGQLRAFGFPTKVAAGGAPPPVHPGPVAGAMAAVGNGTVGIPSSRRSATPRATRRR